MVLTAALHLAALVPIVLRAGACRRASACWGRRTLSPSRSSGRRWRLSRWGPRGTASWWRPIRRRCRRPPRRRAPRSCAAWARRSPPARRCWPGASTSGGPSSPRSRCGPTRGGGAAALGARRRQSRSGGGVGAGDRGDDGLVRGADGRPPEGAGPRGAAARARRWRRPSWRPTRSRRGWPRRRSFPRWRTKRAAISPPRWPPSRRGRRSSPSAARGWSWPCCTPMRRWRPSTR